MSKQNYIQKAISWLSKKPTNLVRAQIDGYDDPKIFTNSRTGEEIQPDFSFVTNGNSKSYLEIALKSDFPQKLVTRWKLLSQMASLKRGKLHLLAPRGHKAFTEKLVNTYNISATVHSL